MTCNCGNGDTPEYYITLDGVGVDGYSPEVNVIDETSSSFKIEAVNKNNTQETPAIPKLGYIQNTYVSNTSLASTLSAYSTTAQINTALAGKLNVDGSNADNPIVLNKVSLRKVDGYTSMIDTTMSRIQLGGSHETQVTGTSVVIGGTNLRIGGISGASKAIIKDSVNDKLMYGTTSTNYEIATLNDIGNGTITITQGGVTKGTFTTNQSGNTTIDLDAGGSSITNPLVISNQAEDRTLSLGIDEDNDKVLFNYSIGGVINVPIPLLYSASQPLILTERSADGLYTLSLNIDSNTLDIDQNDKLTVKEMVGCDSITGGAAGLVPAPSAGDQDKFLKGDGTWDTVGGGGSSYTAGTGINITNDTISVDESVVMTTGNQSTINFGAKQFSNVTVGNGFNTGVGLIGKKNVSGVLFLAQVSTSDDIIFGDNTAPLYLMGSNNRPKYTGGNTLAEDLALYSDIPDVSSFVTTSTLSTTLADYVLSSSLATVATTGSYADLLNKPTIPTNSDYVDLSSNQTVGGNKTFTGTNYLRNTYICNASGTYFGRIRAVDSKFTFEGIGTNRSINFIPDGTGELQYNGTEVATVNDIPDVSQLQEKLTASDGVNIQYNYTPPIVEGLPITLDNDNNIVKVLSYDKAKDDITLTFVVTTSTFTGNFVIGYSDSNAETSVGNGIRMDRYNDGSVTQTVGIATMYYGNLGDELATISASPFNDAGSIYLKLVIHNDSTIGFSYSLDGGITYSTLVSVGGIAGNFHEKYVYMGRGSGQSTVTNVMSNETESVNLISCDDTIQRKLTATGGIKIEPNGGIRVNPLIALPYTTSESSTDKIFNASDTTVDGTEICGKWDVSSVVVFSNNSTALEFGYGFYYNDGIVAMARYNGQYATLGTDSSVSYQSDFYYKIQFYQDGTVKMYYSTDNSTFNLITTTTTASGGALYGQDIYVCGGNSNVLREAYLNIPSTNPIISLDPTTIQGYNSTGTLYLKLVDGVLQWTA